MVPSRRFLRPLLQGRSDLCSQTSIAMVTGLTVEEVVAAIGMVGGLFDEEIRAALKGLGVKIGRTKQWMSAEETQIPAFCIATIVDNKTSFAHAVAILDGLVYDPEVGCPIPLFVYQQFFIKMAFSRIFNSNSKKVRRRSIIAHWDTFVPILSGPPKNPPFTFG